MVDKKKLCFIITLSFPNQKTNRIKLTLDILSISACGICFNVKALFLTFLLKNPYVIMGLGYMFFILSPFISEVIDSFNVFLGITNLSLLTMVSKWMTFGLDAKMNYIFEASLSAEIVWGTIIASVGFGVAALYLGYVFFKNDDMN